MSEAAVRTTVEPAAGEAVAGPVRCENHTVCKKLLPLSVNHRNFYIAWIFLLHIYCYILLPGNELPVSDVLYFDNFKFYDH